jgi:hypothetical protein
VVLASNLEFDHILKDERGSFEDQYDYIHRVFLNRTFRSYSLDQPTTQLGWIRKLHLWQIQSYIKNGKIDFEAIKRTGNITFIEETRILVLSQFEHQSRLLSDALELSKEQYVNLFLANKPYKDSNDILNALNALVYGTTGTATASLVYSILH